MARRPCDGSECGEEPASERPRTIVFSKALTFEAGERVDRTKMALRQAVASAPDMGEGIEGPAQLPWPSATEAETRVYSMLRCLRGAGVEPNPYIDQFPDSNLADKSLAIALAATLEDPTGTLRPEEQVRLDPKLGIRNPLLLLPDASPDGTSGGFSSGAEQEKVSPAMYGRMWEMMRDMGLAGLSIASHAHQGDLPWYVLAAMRKEGTDNDQFPKPNDLIAQLTEDDFFAFRGFTLFVLCCHLYGMKGIPVLFDYGGGSRFNDADASYRALEDPIWAGETSRQDLRKGRPSHQRNPVVTSEHGWNPWYWVHTVNDADSSGNLKAVFQRWALNVWCSDEEDEYMQECARRKSLGVAAFGLVVGRYFAALDAALRRCLGVGLTDYVPYVDCCNELDGFWAVDMAAAMQGTWEEDGDQRIVFELGRLVALLAGGIRQEFPAMRFRMPDLGSNTPLLTWSARCIWLRESIGSGLTEEVDRWNRLWSVLGAAAPSGAAATTEEIVAWLKDDGLEQIVWAALHGKLTGDDIEWFETMSQDGGDDAFFWPLSGGWNKRDLVHQVGIHFFQSLTTAQGATTAVPLEEPLGVASTYGDELHIEERADALVDYCITPLNQAGFDLWWSLFAMCIGATEPDPILGDTWFRGASPAYQAGILARRILYARAMRNAPDMVLWYTVMADVESADEEQRPEQLRTDTWGLYTATGYRNDVVYPQRREDELDDEFKGGAKTLTSAYSDDPNSELRNPNGFWQAKHAWRRRSWFTLRRLVWLLERTQSAKVIFADTEKRQVVLRLVAQSERPFHDPGAVVTALSSSPVPTFRYAYVAWMDEFSPAADDSFSFTLTGAGGRYLRLALVPTVTYDWNAQKAATVDHRTGYPDIETPDWGDDLVDAAVVIRGDDLVVGISKATLTTNPAPLCLLTDAEPAESGLTMASLLPIAGSQEQGEHAALEPGEGQTAPAPPDLLRPG